MKKTVIGITGPLASGKTTAAKLLKSKGFIRVSLTDELRKEVTRRGLSITRKNFLDVGDDLRREFGNEVLAYRTAQTLNELRKAGIANKAVIDGLKNPGEIVFFKKNIICF